MRRSARLRSALLALRCRVALLAKKKKVRFFALVQPGNGDRTADCAAELVALEGGAGHAVAVVRPAVRLELAVSQELEQRTVNSLVPERVATLITPPPVRPYSADRELRDDAELRDAVHDRRVAGLLDADVVLGNDHGSAVDRDLARRISAAADPWSRPGALAGITPGVNVASENGLRPFSGRSRIAELLMTVEVAEVVVAS